MSECQICSKTKAPLECSLCHSSICKSCAVFLEENDFRLLTKNPLGTDAKCFCHICYQNTVIPQLNAYEDLLNRAKEIHVFMKDQGKETRLIPRKEKPVHVENCEDHNETILRLAIFAAEKNMNALVDVEVSGKKVKDGSYTTTIYSGKAVPAEFNDKRVVKDRSIWQNPN